MLDRAPESVRRLAYRVAAGRGLLGQIADSVRFRYAAGDIPRLPPVGDSPVRLLIGPVDAAAQGYLWAHAVERFLPGVTGVAMQGTRPGPFLVDADVRVPTGVYQRSSAWHSQLEAYLDRQTHIIWESALPLLGRRYGSDPLREIAVLRARGVRGALMFHGSDIRPPARHAAGSAWSPFHEPTGPVRSLEDSVTASSQVAADAGVPVFVSTPDLLEWLPGASWCPVVVDPSRWREAGAAPTPDRVLVVAHAPTQRWLKGSDLVEPMLLRLADEGVIDYRRISGVPHDSMPKFYAAADVVLDQFRLGSYGVAACEALAAGKVVMGHIDDSTRQRVRTETGQELPIVEANVDSLESELRRVASDPAAFEQVRSAGRAFVDEVHDGRRSADVLAPFLDLSA